jgi:hypothetical protein
MPLYTATVISAAVNHRNFWSEWANVAAIAVIAGVLIESIAEIGPLTRAFRLDNHEFRRKLIERIGLIILIIGLVGELICEIPIHNDTTLIESSLRNRIDEAAEKVEWVSKKADTENRSANTTQQEVERTIIALKSLYQKENYLRSLISADEKSISWRNFTEQETKCLSRHLKGNSFDIEVAAKFDDAESYNYVWKILPGLKKSGLNPIINGFYETRGFNVNLQILFGSDASKPQAEILQSALNACGAAATIEGKGGGGVNWTGVTLVVGQRSAPTFSSAAKR